MDTVFDEEEVESEIGEMMPRSPDNIPGPSCSKSSIARSKMTSKDRQEESELDSDDDDEDDMEIIEEFTGEDPEGGIYENENNDKSDSDESSQVEILDDDALKFLKEMKYPISQIGLGTKLPDKLKASIEALKAQIEACKQRKLCIDLLKSDKSEQKKVEEVFNSWRASNPETSKSLEEQLTTEFLTYAFIKYMLRRTQPDDDDDDDVSNEGTYQPRTVEEWEFVSDFICSVTRGENEIYKFFQRLKEHESFQQYKPYFESLSPAQMSTLVWDSSLKAQRLIVKLSNLHESALSTLDKIIKLNRESAAIVKTECDYLEARIKKEAEKAIKNYGTTELTTNGRRNLIRALSYPYLKSEEGFAAPAWNPNVLPYTFQQLQESSFSTTEIETFQVAVLKSVIDTKIARIQDRCSQLLIKAMNKGGNTEQRALVGGKTSKTEVASNQIYTQVKIVSSSDDLMKWRDAMIAEAGKLSLEDVAHDSQININWLSVSAKMCLHTSKNCTAEDCERLWKTVVLPNLKHPKQMNLVEIQKLMHLVKTHGSRNWPKVAEEMGPGYTPFQCFSAYEYFSPGEIDAATRNKNRQKDVDKSARSFNNIVKLGKDFSPEMTREKFTNRACQVAGVLVDAPNISLQMMAAHYNRFSNPDVQKGAFRLVEDLLLLVCMVKMREYLKMSQSFIPIKHYLPWRFVSSWACRADILFSRKTAEWSREDDLKLLHYVQNSDKFDWKVFSASLGPDKNRKNTRGRYVRLKERLRFETFANIRAEYERKDRFQAMYTEFSKYLDPLEKALAAPKSNVPTYEELSHNPDDTKLWNYLESFDKSVIQETIQDLKEIIKHGGSLLTPFRTEAQDPLKGLDRRKFIRGDPGSTSSAIHIRKLTLKPKEELETLTTFEEEVYQNFAYFNSKCVKSRTQHKYLPQVKDLLRMTEINKIIVVPNNLQINSEDPTDGTSLDERGYPVLNSAPEIVHKFAPHGKKKKLGWMKAQLVRQENRKKRKLMDESSAPEPEVPASSNDLEKTPEEVGLTND